MGLRVFLLGLAILYTVHAAPPAGQTLGQPWPMPQSYKAMPDVQSLSPDTFQFRPSGQTCDILQDALTRYFRIIFYPDGRPFTHKYLKMKTIKYANSLGEVEVALSSPCEQYPTLGMTESYELTIGAGGGKLSSSSIWGILRGLETFSQIVYQDEQGTFLVNNTMISDAPRFSHRGILLDTSRHFLPIAAIKASLDAFAYNKFNVFHWHIVDDQSFPYQSYTYSDLSKMGAYDPYTHVYTQEDIKEIIEYARVRGIRVIPEFDTPGHTQSWGKGQPNLLTPCSGGGYGPIDPSVNTTYLFLKGLMTELTKVFPDKYIHLGGDEVSFNCWKSNADITKFMQKMGFGTDYSKLEQYYEQNLLDIMATLQHDYIIWQEVIDNGVKVRPDTVVEVWKGGYQAELSKVTQMGYRTLLSSCWYLNEIKYGKDWPNFYKCDPYNFTGSASQKKLVIGGEACLWGEWVDATNVISRLWPRASAVGERLWSAQTLTDANAATPRLEEHRCRMIRRGLQVEPVNGPGFCRHEYRFRH